MASRTSGSSMRLAPSTGAVAGSIALAGFAAATGVAFGALGATVGPWTIVAVPALALWFAAVLSRPVWAIVLVFVSLPIALTNVPIGSLQVVDIVSVGAVGAVVVAVLVGRAEVSLRIPAFGWALALCGAGIVAVPGALQVAPATTRMVSVVVGFLLAVAVVAACRSLADIRILVAALLVVGIVMTLLAFQNLSAIRPEAGGLVVRRRPSGVFGDPNELGSFAVMLLLVSLGALLAKVEPWLRVLAAVSGTLAAGALVLSLSRGSWIGAAIGVIGLMVLLPQFRRALIGVFVCAAVLGLSVGVFRANAPEVQVVRERLGTVGSAIDSPYDDRPSIWAEAIREIGARPLLGFGPANFPYASEKAGSEARTIGAAHAHDVLLTVGAETGLPAVGFLVGMTLAVGFAIRRAVRALRRAPEAALVAGIGAALFGEVGHGLIENTTGNPMLLVLLWVLTGMVLSADRLSDRRPGHRRPGDRGGAASRISAGRAAPSRGWAW